jgi:NAD(P)H-quinone oxidoreductase subunit 5
MAVDSIAAIRQPGPVAINNLAVGRAFLIGHLWGCRLLLWRHGKSPQAIALGAILIGVAYLLQTQGLADAAPRSQHNTAAFSVAAAVGYFTLQNGASG